MTFTARDVLTYMLAECKSWANPPRGVERHYMHGKYPVEFVRTMQGREVPVSVGEWIIKEASGEGYYPIADEEFRRIYEPT